MAMIAQILKDKRHKNTNLTIQKLSTISILISISGLLIWEFLQTKSKKGHFDPHDILWTFLGALTFWLIFRIVHNKTNRQELVSENTVRS